MSLKSLNFSLPKYYNLRSLPLDSAIISTESVLYKYHGLAIKIFINQNSKFLAEKLQVVSDLDKYKQEINAPELVIPTHIISINNQLSGIASPFIRGTNVQLLLSSQRIPIKTKIKILTQIGYILRKVAKSNPSLGLALGDVHPGNFIFNYFKTFTVDLDSAKILDNKNYASLYLRQNPNLSFSTDKYPSNEFGYHDFNSQTDLLCFIIMILNTISGENIHFLKKDVYYHYLDYLSSLGFDKNLLDSFATIYSTSPNTDPTDYLENLKYKPEQTNFEVFKRKK